jgi:WD40 repeat protein
VLRHPVPNHRTGALSCDGRTALTGGGLRLALWSLPSGRLLGGWHMPNDVTAAAFSPDGRTIALAEGDGVAQVWDIAAGRPVGRGMLTNHSRAIVEGLAFSGDGRLLGTACSDGNARLWDVATGRPIGPALPHNGRALAVAFDQGGGLMASGADDRAARLWPVPEPMPGGVAEVRRRVVSMTGVDWDASGQCRHLSNEELHRIRRSP